MQLSEEQLDDLWDECACEDGSIPFVSRRRFVEKVLEFRAQADAWPVAWQVHPFDYGIGSEGVYARTDRQEQVEAWKRKGWAVQALYTHHEASAPGLSEERASEAYKLLAGLITGKGLPSQLDGVSLAIHDWLCEPVSKLTDIIRNTRASAAAVAEPSKIEPMRYEALEQAAQEARAHTESECAKIGLGKAAQQQAEPVADERAAFQAWAISQNWPVGKFPSGKYHNPGVDAAEMAWLARAAQSGQRVGVAEGWRNIVKELADDLESELLERYRAYPGNDRRRVRDMAIVHTARAMLAAAPTQQPSTDQS